MRTLTFTFNWPGLIEATAFELNDTRVAIDSNGYRETGIDDLMVDLDPTDGCPYCFMSANFHENYPAVIWGLKRCMSDERFNVPQANLQAVPLYVTFSWAYYHFILEDGKQLTMDNLIRIDPHNFTQVALAHAAQVTV
jgi:hypothetical protein